MRYRLFILLLLIAGTSHGQELKTKNLVIVTFDGYRWKEVFGGADSINLFGNKFNSQDSAWRIRKYWAPDTTQRRNLLMPFFWNTVATKGQVFGNRTVGNNVNVTNRYWFSYPGYNEIFTGYPDTLVNSNSHPANANINVLEAANKTDAYKGKVAVFTSWDAFHKILNEERSGLPINSGFNKIKGDHLSPLQNALNDLQDWLPKDYGLGERQDAITYLAARDYLQQHHPRVLQVSFIETDALAHSGKYDFYLDAAHYCDAMIADLWKQLQGDPFYKDQTTLIITEDHGRGYGDNWQHHYYTVEHSNEIFFAVMGPDTAPLGEHRQPGQLYQNQFAQTIAAFLGIHFDNGHPNGKPVSAVLPPQLQQR